MAAPRVSIVLPHFQTAILAKLCLRSIRRFTRSVPHEVIVVDNGSRDGESLDYLRQVEWIRLIERTGGISPRPGDAHKEALDIGIAASSAPFILSFHTDSIPLREDWLSWHLGRIEASPRIAAVGTYKLEVKSFWRQGLKDLEYAWLRLWERPESQGDHQPYIRSHCALYRREALKALGLRFVDGSAESAGRTIHFALRRAGLEPRLLSAAETARRLAHLNHGTMVLVAELGVCRKTARVGSRRIQDFLARPSVRELLADHSLDRCLDRNGRRAA